MTTVLIVEDDKDLHKAYKTVLEKEGYQVIGAFNGKQALDLTQDNKPSLILLDLHMPEMNGIEFLKQFENRKGSSKIVIFSNVDTKKEIDTARQLGADRYILKAWASPQELIKIVRDALAA